MSERKTNRPPVATRCLRDLYFPEGINLELWNEPEAIAKMKSGESIPGPNQVVYFAPPVLRSSVPDLTHISSFFPFLFS
jgi:hypothetical protein